MSLNDIIIIVSGRTLRDSSIPDLLALGPRFSSVREVREPTSSAPRLDGAPHQLKPGMEARRLFPGASVWEKESERAKEKERGRGRVVAERRGSYVFPLCIASKWEWVSEACWYHRRVSKRVKESEREEARVWEVRVRDEEATSLAGKINSGEPANPTHLTLSSPTHSHDLSSSLFLFPHNPLFLFFLSSSLLLYLLSFSFQLSSSIFVSPLFSLTLRSLSLSPSLVCSISLPPLPSGSNSSPQLHTTA